MLQQAKGFSHSRPAVRVGVLLLIVPVGSTLLSARALTALSQIQIGTVRVLVADPARAVVPAAAVTLANELNGYHSRQVTDDYGYCTFNNVPFDDYTLRVEAAQFAPAARRLSVRSNLPVVIELALSLPGARESVTVQAERGLVEADSSSTAFDLNETSIRRAPGVVRGVQQSIATMPGRTTENNGLLHVRGVDDGILFVIDGVPVTDREDRTTAAGVDPAMISSMTVLTGDIPAEFGGKSGAVVTIVPKSGISRRLFGSFETSGGTFRAGDASASLGAGGKRLGLFLSGSGSRSERFLDPVDPHNLNNFGGAVRFNTRVDWHPTADDILIFTASANGSGLQVPNTEPQQLAGQRQRQELRDNSQSISWQRV